MCPHNVSVFVSEDKEGDLQLFFLLLILLSPSRRRMLVSSVLALTLSLAGVQATPLYERAAPTVSTSDGSTFVGKASSSVESFLGIPFAQPPVGALRFAAPVPMNGPLGTFDATRYGFACPQMNIINGASQRRGKVSVLLADSLHPPGASGTPQRRRTTSSQHPYLFSRVHDHRFIQVSLDVAEK